MPENVPGTSVGPLVFSGAYVTGRGSEHNRFIVGTVWDDLDFDDEYDEGEGLAGVLVMPDSGTYYAVTGEAGGYAIPITAAGSYMVAFSGGDLGASEVQLPVELATDRELLDLKVGAPDRDNDGVPDAFDDFPDDPTETTDSDGDGVGDNSDAFPDDPTETEDRDNDGYGDNRDAFPDDDSEWLDSDDDGVGDNSDPYPVGHYDDVPPGHPAYHHIEALADAAITRGCSATGFCPRSVVTRAQLAVILVRAANGGGFAPPAADGSVFQDVGAADAGADFVERLFADGITLGCDAQNFCPDAVVTRSQLALLLLRMEHGVAYDPPAALGTVFDDVPIDLPGAAWIERLAAENVTVGCDADNFCPDQALTRDVLALMLARILGLVP